MSTDCLYDCRGAILIGGPSGAGKSSVVSALVRNQAFARLPALSTRPPRGPKDDEYKVATTEQLRALELQGQLVNLDEVYGNSYAVSLEDFRNAQFAESTPVKEIHPENFPKFERVCPHSLTVILLSDKPVADGRGASRQVQDAAYYSDIQRLASRAHVVLIRDHFPSVDAIAEHIVNAWAAFRSLPAWPDCRSIDIMNQYGYSALAQEFRDDMRITTADFHSASEGPLRSQISGFPAGISVLEVGTGTGWLASRIDMSRFNYIPQDSARMRPEDVGGPPLLVCPVRALPLLSNSIDLVIGSLVDGLLHPLNLLEMSRVLRPGGTAILSWPSSVWTHHVARRDHLARFRTTADTEVAVHSFTPDRDETNRLFKVTGLSLEDFLECPPMKTDDRAFSPALLNASGEPPDAVVSVVVGRKE